MQNPPTGKRHENFPGETWQLAFNFSAGTDVFFLSACCQRIPLTDGQFPDRPVFRCFPREKIRYVLTVLNQSFHHFLAGQTIEAVILGMLCTIGMWILRLPYAAMIGCLVGVTALLPVIGAYIGAAAGACMLLTVSPVKALVFLIFLTILQQIEGNFIYPRVVGHSIGLPGIWVLAAVIVGGGAFGIWGILFAVPLAAAIYRLLRPSIN